MKILKHAVKSLASLVATFMGSWWSVISFGTIISIWVLINTLPYTVAWHIDAYPYSFLNLILGVFASLTGPLVLIGSKSQERRYQKLIESIYTMEKKQNDILMRKNKYIRKKVKQKLEKDEKDETTM